MKNRISKSLATLTAVSLLSPVLSSYNHLTIENKPFPKQYLSEFIKQLSVVKMAHADDEMEKIEVTYDGPTYYTTPFLFTSYGSGTSLNQDFNTISPNTLGGATPYSREEIVPEGMLDDLQNLMSIFDGLLEDLAENSTLSEAQKSQLRQIARSLRSASALLAAGDVLSEYYLNNNLTGAEKSAMLFALSTAIAAIGGLAMPLTVAAGLATLVTYAVDRGGLFDQGFDSFDVEVAIIQNKLDYYYNLDLNQLTDSNGTTFRDAYRQFVCDLSLCMYIPPLIIDLDGDGVKLAKLGDTTVFIDVDNDGYKENVEWPGPNEGIVFYDFNGDGLLSSWDEIMLSRIGETSYSDLAGLSSLDENRDNRLNASDSGFEKVGVWTDTNQDGIPQIGEYDFLPQTDIKEISLLPNVTVSKSDFSSILSSVHVYTYSNPDSPILGYDTMLAASESGHKVVTENSYFIEAVDEQSRLSRDYSISNLPVELELNDSNTSNDLYGVRTGSFDDQITVETKKDVKVITGEGNDQVLSTKNSRGKLHTITGGGNDTVTSTNAVSRVYTEDGNDVVNLVKGLNRVDLGSGDDTVVISGGNTILSLGEGRDKINITKGKVEVTDFSSVMDELTLPSKGNYKFTVKEYGLEVKGPKIKLYLYSKNEGINPSELKVSYE